MNNEIFNCRQKGFSLVELMVAMVIGLVIILGAGQLFLSGLQNFRQVEVLGNKQATLIFVSDILLKEIRRGEFDTARYVLKDAEDGESCTLFDTVDNQPIVDGFSESAGGECGGKLDVMEDSDTEGLYLISLSLEGESSPFYLYAMNRTVAIDNR